MPICIAGMHRSGTSMVARLLKLCGLYLGEDDEMYPADEKDNPEGFWENRHFIEINDRILRTFGGDFYHPPAFPRDWVRDVRLQDARETARALAQRLGQRGPWGWKDPRNSLTLAFWRDLAADLKIIVCVRNPAEVALSLARRDYIETFDWGVSLWDAYHDAILECVKGADALCTNYESYFYDPQRELRRLAEFAGLTPDPKAFQEAIGTISTKVRRHAMSRPLLQLKLPAAVYRRYAEIGENCGLVYQEFLSDKAYQLKALEADLHRLYGELQSDERAANEARLEEKIVGLRKIIDEQTKAIESLRSGYSALETEYKNVLQAYESHTARILELEKQMNSARETIVAQRAKLTKLQRGSP